MDSREFEEVLHNYIQATKYYYTDGVRYYGNPSVKGRRSLRYVGRYRSAKEAKKAELDVIQPKLF